MDKLYHIVSGIRLNVEDSVLSNPLTNYNKDSLLKKYDIKIQY